jgi:hypothetical protein
MRILILGIVGLSGLGFVVQSIGVHGSTDERAAIKRAVRAPFADLQRRDAHALCEDFMPSVAARLAPGPGENCEQRVSAFFERSRDAGEYVPASGAPAHRRLAVSAIHWTGDRATAAPSYRAGIAGEQAWRLELHGLRWRIATPAKLEMRADCAGHPFGASGCIYAVSLHFVSG